MKEEKSSNLKLMLSKVLSLETNFLERASIALPWAHYSGLFGLGISIFAYLP